MSASKIADYHGLLPGNVLMTADVTSAYLQAEITGTKTWVELPIGRWPDNWFHPPKCGRSGAQSAATDIAAGDPREAKYRRPVVPLEMALYGHPDAGGIWEQHFDAKVKKFDFHRASDRGLEWMLLESQAEVLPRRLCG